MSIKPLLREVKEAEKRYFRALLDYGPNNQETVRREIEYREMKAARDASRQAYLNQYE